MSAMPELHTFSEDNQGDANGQEGDDTWQYEGGNTEMVDEVFEGRSPEEHAARVQNVYDYMQDEQNELFDPNLDSDQMAMVQGQDWQLTAEQQEEQEAISTREMM